MDITLLKEIEERETEKSEIIIRGQRYSHDSTKSLCIQSVSSVSCQLSQGKKNWVGWVFAENPSSCGGH
jgi:hypothetical protein